MREATGEMEMEKEKEKEMEMEMDKSRPRGPWSKRTKDNGEMSSALVTV